MYLHKQTAPNFSELRWCSVFALPGKGFISNASPGKITVYCPPTADQVALL